LKDPSPVQSCRAVRSCPVVGSCSVEPHANQSVRSSPCLISTSSRRDCLKLSRPVLIAFLLLCVGPSPLLALGSDLRDLELELNWETEMSTFQGLLTTVVPFLLLWFISVGIYGTQRGIIRSYAREENEVACPRDLIFPPMVEANPHADNDPPRRHDPGRGVAASRGAVRCWCWLRWLSPGPPQRTPPEPHTSPFLQNWVLLKKGAAQRVITSDQLRSDENKAI